MKLKEYIDANGLEPASVAKKLGVKPISVGRYLAGERIPEPKVMKKIKRMTGGTVTANDFYH